MSEENKKLNKNVTYIVNEQGGLVRVELPIKKVKNEKMEG